MLLKKGKFGYPYGPGVGARAPKRGGGVEPGLCGLVAETWSGMSERSDLSVPGRWMW